MAKPIFLHFLAKLNIGAYIEIKNPNILYCYFNVYKYRTVVHRVTWLTPEAQSNILFGSLDIFSTHDRLTMNYWLKFKD